jgi:signal transduction histidine kinase
MSERERLPVLLIEADEGLRVALARLVEQDGRDVRAVPDRAAAGEAPAAADSDQVVLLARARLGLEERRAMALGRLTEPFAHELRNALGGLRCYLELMAAVELPTVVAGLFGELESTVDRIGALAGRWLELSSGCSATPSPNLELRRLKALLASTGVGRRVEIEEDLDPEVAAVAVEPRRLQSALFAVVGDLLELRPKRLRFASRALGGEVRLQLAASRLEVRAVATADPEQLALGLGGRGHRLDGGEVGVELWLRAVAGVRIEEPVEPPS